MWDGQAFDISRESPEILNKTEEIAWKHFMSSRRKRLLKMYNFCNYLQYLVEAEVFEDQSPSQQLLRNMIVLRPLQNSDSRTSNISEINVQ